MSNLEDLSLESENEVYITGDEGEGQETEPNAGHHDLERRRSANNGGLQGKSRDAQLSIEVPSGHRETSTQPASAWSSSSSEEEEEGETAEDIEYEEAVIHSHTPDTGEHRSNIDATDARTSHPVSDQTETDAPLGPVESAFAVKNSSSEDATSLDKFLTFDGVWSVDDNANSQPRSGAANADNDEAANEVPVHLRLHSETLEDNDADDEASPMSPSFWPAQELLAIDRHPHLRSRRFSITDQYKDHDLHRGRGNLETAIKRSIQRLGPAEQKIYSLTAYERPHEGGERMGDPRVKAHLRPGEHANTPRKPSPLRRYEDGEAIANETHVIEPRSPDCVLLPRVTDEEKQGWSIDEMRQHLRKKWRPDSQDKIMPEDMATTSERLAELLEEDSDYSTTLHSSLAELLRACRQASASSEPDIRRAFLIPNIERDIEQRAPARAPSAKPRLDIPLSLVSTEKNIDTHVVSPIKDEAKDQQQWSLPISAQDLEDATEMTTQEALTVAEEWEGRCDGCPISEFKSGVKWEGAAERLAKKRTKAIFEWDYEEYRMRRHGIEGTPRPKLPEDPKERAEYARAMAHRYHWERDEARRKAGFLLDGAKEAERLRNERDKLRESVSDYKRAIGQNFAEIAILEGKLRQKCQDCGKSKEDLRDSPLDVAAAGDTLRCLDGSHAELEQELTGARDRVEALHEENERMEASLQKKKVKLAELKAFAMSWKQKAEAAQAQAEQVQELADCELIRRATERGNKDHGTDSDDSIQRAYEEKVSTASRKHPQRQYDELTEKYDDCKKRLEQTTQNHHDDLRKMGDEQRELRSTMAQLELQCASLQSQIPQAHSRSTPRHLSPAYMPDRATPASTQRPITPPEMPSSRHPGTPSMTITQPSPPKIDTDLSSTLDPARNPAATPRTPGTPGLSAFLADKGPATPAMDSSRGWQNRNVSVLESQTYQRVKKRLDAHRQEQCRIQLREKEVRDKAYFDTFGTWFEPMSVSEKKTTYYKLAHTSKHKDCHDETAAKKHGVERTRSQERIRHRTGVEATYREEMEVRLNASRDYYNARSPTKPYRWTNPDEEDTQTRLERKLWGSGSGSKT